jgi:NAD(P)H-dependent flavin oxidoreductase YrpB (nitropropane dioxygenase family)
MVLVPLIAGQVNIPVVAAGGIGTARGLVAALALGAEGISMGSRFIVTQEAPVPLHVKEHLLGRTEEDTVVTDNFTGVRCRVLKNDFSESLVKMARDHTDPWEIMKSGVGKIRKAYVEGDIYGGSLTFGQICGLIREIPSCRELIHSIVTEAEEVMQSIQEKVLPSAKSELTYLPARLRKWG